MALFESYERRIDQINAVLNSYGISSIEEAEKITKDAGLDVYDQVKKIQPICFENACWAYTVGAAIAIKKGCRRAADAAAAIVCGYFMVRELKELSVMDKKKKEEAEIKNNANSLISSSERIVKDFEGKISEEDVKKLTEHREALQKALDENKSSDELKKLSEELQQTMFAISQKAYEAVQKEGGDAQSEANSQGAASEDKKDDDVIDAEFTKE